MSQSVFTSQLINNNNETKVKHNNFISCGGSNGKNGTSHNESLPDLYGSIVFQAVEDATNYILKRLTNERPTIGIVCGSGLGGLANLLSDTEVFPYSNIPNFPVSSVIGHAGKLIFGKLGGKKIVCMQGRVHMYEGIDQWKITLPIRVMANLGIKTLIVTNAAGGLNDKYAVGDVMIIKDHINIPSLSGNNPLVGIHDERLGARFVPMTDAYDRELRRVAVSVANSLNMSYVHEGIYCMQAGPIFETVAECRFIRMLGADAVGMSTAPEVAVARQHGVQVLGLSLITNTCVVEYDTGREPCHQEVIETGQHRALDMQNFVSKIIADLQ